MTKVVYKYPIKSYAPTRVAVSKSYRVLFVDVQQSKPMVWIERQTPEETRHTITLEFHVFATGEPFDHTDLVYLNSFLMDGGMYVFHVYYKEVE